MLQTHTANGPTVLLKLQQHSDHVENSNYPTDFYFVRGNMSSCLVFHILFVSSSVNGIQSECRRDLDPEVTLLLFRFSLFTHMGIISLTEQLEQH